MKSDRQYRDAALGACIGWIGILLLCLIMVLFSGCYGTYYLTDAEYSDARETNASVTYYTTLGTIIIMLVRHHIIIHHLML